MNCRDGLLEVMRLQHARVEHEGMEVWEGNRRIISSCADTTPNATPMSVWALLNADRIGAETKWLPVEYERRQIGNSMQHRAKRAEINHGPG